MFDGLAIVQHKATSQSFSPCGIFSPSDFELSEESQDARKDGR